MSFAQVPNGITLVVETKERVYFGRLDTGGNRIALRNGAVAAIAPGERREQAIRNTARFGFPAELETIPLAPEQITKVRRLGEVPKD